MRRALAAIVTAAIPMVVFAQGSGVDFSKAKLKNPATFTDKAPETFKARFETSKGVFVVTVHRAWAPLGADRFYNLVNGRFYDDCRFFRVIDGFMAQVGMNGDPAIQSAWGSATISDDPVKERRTRLRIIRSHDVQGPRSTQFFVSLVDNTRYDKMGFAPFGEVTSGHGRRRQAVQRVRRRRAARQGSGAGETPGTGKRIPHERVPEAGSHQEGVDRKITGCPSCPSCR